MYSNKNVVFKKIKGYFQKKTHKKELSGNSRTKNILTNSRKSIDRLRRKKKGKYRKECKRYMGHG